MDSTDYQLQMKEDLGTPGRLTPPEYRAKRREYIQFLQWQAVQHNTGHAVEATTP